MTQSLQQFVLKGELSISETASGLPIININNSLASARISLYGGQLLDFKPHDQEESILWLSDKAQYRETRAIRGGIPVCWPWFGDFSEQVGDFKEQFSEEFVNLNENLVLPAHGYARISLWEIQSTQSLPDGGTQLVLTMPCHDICLSHHDIQPHFDCDLSLIITINKTLKLEMQTKNRGQSPIIVTEALHSYFNVSDIHNVSINGLDQKNYRDKVNGGQSFQQDGMLKFNGETDRVFIDTQAEIQLLDHGFNRKIIISKDNSNSTVIWNPWQKKSAAMSDMSDESWLTMVCIESANVNRNKVVLNPGQMHVLTTLIAVEELM